MPASVPTSPHVFEFQSTFTPSDTLQASTALPTLSSALNSIRNTTRTLPNRLRSIHHDSQFVYSVARAYGNLPLVPNARAGDWYVPPDLCAGGVYFKSTDGHYGEWGFSLRRLNLGLLEIAGRDDGRGAVIVDSTRRGKRFPDSLAKTLPIWIAVLNSALFALPLTLHTTPLAVSATEHSQIEALLPKFLAAFLALGLDLAELRQRLPRPMRPLFVTPTSTLPDEVPRYAEFVPLVLVTASMVMGGEGVEGEYIQGAGDDHEGWAKESGLTPALFWENVDVLLETEPERLLETVQRLVGGGGGGGGTGGDVTLLKPTENIFIAATGAAIEAFDVVIDCAPTRSSAAATSSQRYIHFPIPPDKRGNKPLRLELPALLDTLQPVLAAGQRVVFMCETGNAVAPVVALAVLARFYGEEGEFRILEYSGGKEGIRKRLAWISAARPGANPARGLLNAINSVLMG
ncbi:tRNA A64-2'-O-ribosylphosphate transferase [Geopyxis carbonaria]|nr:tRNA A64-2'-O-ribosylphosphate transferase [Geopyxis carbonaria]